MAQEEIMKDLVAQSPNRRSFVRKLGIASAAVSAIAAAGSAQAQSSSGVTDVDILNFALNLEYLEAEFYTVATTGRTIQQFKIVTTGSGNLGLTTGGNQIAWTDPTVQRIATELAVDEQTHVSLLQNAIAMAGGQAIAKPAINLNALGFGFASQNDFLKLARIFEEIGVTAYGGAAPLIQDKGILGYAARVLATEAEHVGTIRRLIDQYQIATAPPLDGADILPPPSGAQYFSTNGSAITAVRTPQQVLFLAYAAANVKSGGFFPSGVNGSLNTSAASGATLDGNIFTASPNPIPAASAAGGYGATTLKWQSANPATQVVQIRVNSPDGPVVSEMGDSGSIQTGAWVSDGTTFYLQDVTNGNPLLGLYTLATVTVRVGQS